MIWFVFDGKLTRLALDLLAEDTDAWNKRGRCQKEWLKSADGIDKIINK